MLDLGEEDDEPDRADRSVFPPGWWAPGAIYSGIYAGCTVATIACIAALSVGRFRDSMCEIGSCFGVLVVGTFLLCNFLPPIASLWLNRVFYAQTPVRYVVTVGAVSGCLAGAGYFGLSLPRDRVFEQVGLITLFIVGPIPGLLWLVYRKPKPIDVDYDDEMSGAGEVDLGNDE